MSTSDGPTQWLVGTFYSNTEATQETVTNLTQIIPDSVQDLNSKALSVFGELSRAYRDGTVVPLVGLRY
ncbi:MAG: hypothetical protein R3E64_12245 [Halioglobus sp.]